MKHMARLMALAIIPALAASLCSACGGTTSQPQSTTDEESTQAQQEAEAQPEAEAKAQALTNAEGTQIILTPPKMGEPVENVEGTPLLQFEEGNGPKLIAEMEAGQIPVECSVLYDEEGGRPVITVTDPETITRLYELAKDITVTGKTNMSVTDCYHHFYFTLQDGSKAGFSFEGEDIAHIGKSNYSVVGGDRLWTLVRILQDEVIDDDKAPQWHKIIVDAGDDLITEFPEGAYHGEVVTIRTVGVADEILSVYANGEQLKASGVEGTTYIFVMPDFDVHLEASTHPYVGFGGA